MKAIQVDLARKGTSEKMSWWILKEVVQTIILPGDYMNDHIILERALKYNAVW